MTGSSRHAPVVAGTRAGPRARRPGAALLVATALAALVYLIVGAGRPATVTLAPDIRDTLVRTALREGAADGDPHPSAAVYVVPSDAPCRRFFRYDLNGYCAEAKYMLVVRGDFLCTRCLRSPHTALRYPRGVPSNEIVVALDASAAPLLESHGRTRGPRPYDWGWMTSL